MSNKGKIIIWLLVATLFAVIGYLVTQLMKISGSPLKYAGMKINSASLNNINLTAFFSMDNRGTASVSVSKQEYDVYINGKYVSHMSNLDTYTITPGVNIMPLKVDLKLADVLRAGAANFSDILNDKSKINISLKGKRSMKIGFLSFNNVVIDETFNLGSMGNN